MLMELAKRLVRVVHIFHKEHKVHTYYPPDWDTTPGSQYRPAIVYSVWGEHAYFYQPGVISRDAAKIEVRKRLTIRKILSLIHI